MKDKKCSKKATIRISGELTCQAQVGWICPRCGRGVAPWAKECSCVPPFVIRWAEGRSTTFDPRQPQETTSRPKGGLKCIIVY